MAALGIEQGYALAEMLANDRQRPGRAAAERPAEDDLPGSLDQIGQEPCLASAFQ